MKGRLITNPGWYARGIGKEITDLDVADSMSNYFARVMATMDLMLSVNEEVVSLEDIGSIAWIVRDMTDEAKTLLDQWWEDKSKKKPDKVTAIK